jgi:hypothetical protein
VEIARIFEEREKRKPIPYPHECQHGPLSLEYIAGFIDGEGCIYIPAHLTAGPKLLVTNTDLEVLSDMQAFFGGLGRIHEHSYSGGFERRKRCWNWVCWNRHAETVLRQVLPYLRLKRRRAELALEWLATMDGHRKGIGSKGGRSPIPPEVVEMRHRIKEDARIGK